MAMERASYYQTAPCLEAIAARLSLAMREHQRGCVTNWGEQTMNRNELDALLANPNLLAEELIETYEG